MRVKDYIEKLRKCDNNIYLMHRYLFLQLQRIRNLDADTRENELVVFESLFDTISIPTIEVVFFKRQIEEIRNKKCES